MLASSNTAYQTLMRSYSGQKSINFALFTPKFLFISNQNAWNLLWKWWFVPLSLQWIPFRVITVRFLLRNRLRFKYRHCIAMNEPCLLPVLQHGCLLLSPALLQGLYRDKGFLILLFKIISDLKQIIRGDHPGKQANKCSTVYVWLAQACPNYNCLLLLPITSNRYRYRYRYQYRCNTTNIYVQNYTSFS